MNSLSRVWLFVTPWTVAYHAPPSMGFSRQECWSGLPFPSPGDLPNPGIKSRSPALQADTIIWATREAPHQAPSELRYIVFLRQESAVAPFTWQAIKLSFSTSPRFCLQDSIQHQCREAKLSTLLLTPCTIQICKYRVVCHRDSLQDEKECYLLRRCLVDAKRMFLYMVEQVFLPMGRFDQCVIQIHIAQ